MRLGIAFSPASASAANCGSAATCGMGSGTLAKATITAPHRTSNELGQPHAAELPTRRGIEEVPVAHPLVTGRGRKRGAAQHHLVDHELAVVFTERPFGCAVARIWEVGASGPLPDRGKNLLNQARPGRGF